MKRFLGIRARGNPQRNTHDGAPFGAALRAHAIYRPERGPPRSRAATNRTAADFKVWYPLGSCGRACAVGVSSTLHGNLGGLVFLIASLVACESKVDKQLKELHLTEQRAREILREISGHPAQRPPPVQPEAVEQAEKPETTAAPLAPQALDPSLVSADWVVDGLVDIAPAAPSVATAAGVVVINAKNELWLAALTGLARGREPAESRLETLDDSHGPFALGRGPSVADGYAYWVTNHFLLRRPTTPPFGPLEILAEDARIGTRTSILPKATDRKRASAWVAYIALPEERDGPLRAKLWHGKEDRLLLTPPGNSALSVGLFDTGHRVFALSIEARTGATALHSRELLGGSKPRALQDEIVWVGGGAQPMTELHLLKPPRPLSPELVSLLPIEQDVRNFGLLTLHFADITQHAEPSISWALYKNGLEPAPVGSATLCGQAVALFARPSDSQPGSPQELVLAKVDHGKLGTEVILTRSKAFYDISLAGLDRPSKAEQGLSRRGALLSYVADHRTWGCAVRCINNR